MHSVEVFSWKLQDFYSGIYCTSLLPSSVASTAIVLCVKWELWRHKWEKEEWIMSLHASIFTHHHCTQVRALKVPMGKWGMKYASVCLASPAFQSEMGKGMKYPSACPLSHKAHLSPVYMVLCCANFHMCCSFKFTHVPHTSSAMPVTDRSASFHTLFTPSRMWPGVC